MFALSVQFKPPPQLPLRDQECHLYCSSVLMDYFRSEQMLSSVFKFRQGENRMFQRIVTKRTGRMGEGELILQT